MKTQTFIIAGPPGSGKSLIADIITKALSGKTKLVEEVKEPLLIKKQQDDQVIVITTTNNMEGLTSKPQEGLFIIRL